MILLTVLSVFLIVALIVYLICLGIFLADNEGILNDQIMKDYLDKLGIQYDVYISEYSQRIEPLYSAEVKKSIDRSSSIIGLVFPYYIEYVGVIPVWSKSKSRIDAMFATGVESDWKRKKLGLN